MLFRSGNGTLGGGTLSNVYPLVRGMYNKREDEITAIGLNNRFKLAGVALDADISYSKAERDELSLENNTQLTPAPVYDTTTIRFNQATSRPSRWARTTATCPSCCCAARSTVPATARHPRWRTNSPA